MKLSERAVKLIRIILPILLAVMLGVCAVLFIISAYSINKIGQSPYTYETIGAAFRKIAVPVYCTLALTVVCALVLTFGFPTENGRVKPPRDALSRLKRAYRTADLSTADEKTLSDIRFERILRKSIRLSDIFLFAIGMLITFFCAINPENYAEGISSHELTESVLGVVKAALIYLAPATLVAIARIPIDSLSAEKELSLVERLPRRRITPTAANKGKIPYSLIIRLSVLTLAVVFIILGIFNGGMSDVVQKAIKICTECIGLG